MEISQLWQDVILTGITGSSDNQKVFLRAINSVRKDINRRLHKALQDDTSAEITTVSDTLDIDVWVENVVWPGIKFYMQRYGCWAQDPDAEAWSFYQQQFASAMVSEIEDLVTAGTFRTRNQSAEA